MSSLDSNEDASVVCHDREAEVVRAIDTLSAYVVAGKVDCRTVMETLKLAVVHKAQERGCTRCELAHLLAVTERQAHQISADAPVRAQELLAAWDVPKVEPEELVYRLVQSRGGKPVSISDIVGLLRTHGVTDPRRQELAIAAARRARVIRKAPRITAYQPGPAPCLSVRHDAQGPSMQRMVDRARAVHPDAVFTRHLRLGPQGLAWLNDQLRAGKDAPRTLTQVTALTQREDRSREAGYLATSGATFGCMALLAPRPSAYADTFDLVQHGLRLVAAGREQARLRLSRAELNAAEMNAFVDEDFAAVTDDYLALVRVAEAMDQADHHDFVLVVQAGRTTLEDTPASHPSLRAAIAAILLVALLTCIGWAAPHVWTGRPTDLGGIAIVDESNITGPDDVHALLAIVTDESNIIGPEEEPGQSVVDESNVTGPDGERAA